MISPTEHIEEFDAYLRGEMTEAEQKLFEQKLSEDSRFRHHFESHRKLVDAISEASEYGDIRAQLRRIHQTPGVVEKPFFKSPQFLVPLSIAAGLALLFVVVSPFIQQGDATGEGGDYQYLTNREEVYSPSASSESYESTSADSSAEIVPQDKLIVTEQEFAPVEKIPSGTCFLISNQGYFLTSKHLVENLNQVTLQQKDLKLTFAAQVIYKDSLTDFAILQCHPKIAAQFSPVPFKFATGQPEIGQEVFTLGYPKEDIVFTQGVISSETGYKSDSLSFETSLPSNPGNSGAPLFTSKGDLIGIINATNSKKQAVTYVLGSYYINQTIDSLRNYAELPLSTESNYTKKFKSNIELIRAYRIYVFELYP